MSLQKMLFVPLLVGALAVPAFAHGKPEHGGQSVEVDGHSFELVTEPETKVTHLDLYINDPKEKPVSTATVKLQISTPNGQKVSLPLKYEGGHYTALLNAVVKGEYKVVALTSIGAKKLNSRFSFKR
jgi:ribosomal protein L25 (general stress protein Ctc)